MTFACYVHCSVMCSHTCGSLKDTCPHTYKSPIVWKALFCNRSNSKSYARAKDTKDFMNALWRLQPFTLISILKVLASIPALIHVMFRCRLPPQIKPFISNFFTMCLLVLSCDDAKKPISGILRCFWTRKWTDVRKQAGLGLRKFTNVLNIKWKTIKTLNLVPSLPKSVVIIDTALAT